MVFDWFRRRSASPPPEGSIDPDSECGRFLVGEARLLAKRGRKLVDRVTDFLLTGRDFAVLEALRRQPKAAKELGLEQAKGRAGGWNMRGLHEVDRPDALVRLGSVYAAVLPDDAFGSFETPDVPRWLQTLLWEGSNHSPFGASTYPARIGLSARRCAAALELAGDSPEVLVRLALCPSKRSMSDRALTLAMEDIGPFLVDHADVVAAALAVKDAAELTLCLDTLKESRADVMPWLARVAELACDRRKTVHSAARGLLGDHWSAATSTLREVAVSGSPAEREQATELLARHGGEAAHEFLRERVEVESSRKVAQSIRDRLDVAPEPESCERPASRRIAPDVTAPPRDAFGPPEPLTHAQSKAVHVLAAAIDRALAKHRSRFPEGRGFHPTDVAAAIASIESREPWPEPPEPRLNTGAWLDVDKELTACCRTVPWSPIQLLRLLYHVQVFRRRVQYFLNSYTEPYIVAARDAHDAGWELRDLADAGCWLGYDVTHLGREILTSFGFMPYRWGAERVWPYFDDHRDVLASAMHASPATHGWSWQEQIERSFEILAMFPKAPADLLPDMWKVALGTVKRARAAAQRGLASETDLVDRVVAALTDGKQEVRSVAARWLAELGDASTVPAIEAALQKERSDVAKAAMFSALESLGQSVDRYIDRDVLRAEAAKRLKKIPKGLDALLRFELPAVHWQDDGAEVEPEVLRWWLVKTAKLKDPAPDPLLRRYASMLREDDRHALGESLLTSWIEEDTRKPDHVTPEDDRRIRDEARSWQPYYPDLSLEQVVEVHRRHFLENPAGSAIKLKGVLAVPSACGGAALAPLVDRFLRDWYGLRAAQCKALLAMLSRVDDSNATQLLLATASRFRTAGIRKEAERLVHEIADRRGWTTDELADRTLPSAGFDGEGRQEVRYLRRGPRGPAGVSRTFTLRLTDALGIEIAKEDGATLKNLPAARPDEDEDSVKGAKKTLSESKKAIKQILKQQRLRIYEAMCSERCWTVGDWRTFLLSHPIVGHLCRRVVWATGREREDPAVVRLFRPRDDGRLCDLHGTDVALDDDSFVRVAHRTLVEHAVAIDWQRQSFEFGYEPLLEQFSSLLVDVPEDLENSTKIDSVEGHMIRAYRLRNAAKKRDYVRGAAEDAGWFMTYHKPFPSLRIEVVLEFTGNPLPEEDRDTALLAAYFEELRDDDRSFGPSGRLKLSEVPRVLLDEVRSDLALIAERGTGFDPDWAEKIGY